jgi:hypothetical protein
MGRAVAPFLHKMGWWKPKGYRSRTPWLHGHPKPRKEPASFVRVYTYGTRDWFHATLEAAGKSGWRAVISWCTEGRKCLLTSFTELSPFDAATKVDSMLKVYETQARLGWVPFTP